MVLRAYLTVKDTIMRIFCSLLMTGFLASQLTAQNMSTANPNMQNAPRNTIDWCEDYSKSKELSQRNSKPILILFTGTSWCPACMKLEREVINNPRFAQAVGNNFIFYKAEFSEPTEEAMMRSPDKALVDRYGIKAFPTMIVIDGNGKQLFTVNYRAGGVDSYAQELNQKLQAYQPNRNF